MGLRDAGAPVERLWAVRHGRSLANEALDEAEREGRLDSGVDGPDRDVPLTAVGRLQAAAVGRWWRSLPHRERPRAVYVSPYLRARQTLDEIWTQLSVEPEGQSWPVEVHVDERLRDRESGVLELMTTAAIRLNHPDEVARRLAVGDVAYRPPGGESLGDVAARVREFLHDVERGPAPRVLVVAHDATVLMLRAVIEDLDEPGIAGLMGDDPVANASISQWQRSGHQWTLHGYNDTAHLADPTVS
jgi:2,3-bisphosphoglycerate-dependent phosphoglycerate mutase